MSAPPSSPEHPRCSRTPSTATTSSRSSGRTPTASSPEGVDPSDIPDADTIDIGVSESRITTTVDVREFVDRKRAAMAAHASQIPENSFFLRMPPDVFSEAFGYEWFIRRGAPAGARETSLLEH